jgi:type II secretory pathway pseudopilin PulG
MGLRGQGWRRTVRESERGYAMAALLIALAIMGILMSVAMPVWRQEARREKEAELVFRGEQYARAIALYRFKNANIPNAFPPSIDMLVDGRYLRKKYKDPMTKDGEFQIMPVGASLQPNNPTAPGGRGNVPPIQVSPNSPVSGGIMGVRSKSEENSLRSYRGQTRYDQWAFTFNVAPRPGGAMPMANSPDGRGGDGRGGPGTGNPFGAGPGGPRGGDPRGGGPGPRGTGPRGVGPGGRNPGSPPTFPPFGPSGGRSGRGQ